MSKREEMRRKRREQARHRQLGLLAGTLVLALSVIGYLVYQNTRPIGAFKTVERESLPFADGKALGAAGAPVLIQEFSDFQ